MASKTRTDARDYEALKKLGFELEAPQDEFSYQPDSGSVADGAIGEQEYGITVDLDAVSRAAERLATSSEFEDPATPIPGESSWSQKHRLPQEPVSPAPSVSNEELLLLVLDRLAHHPDLYRFKIAAHVKRGAVILRGEVPTDAAKLQVTELVAALPGVTDIYNELSIVRAGRDR